MPPSLDCNCEHQTRYMPDKNMQQHKYHALAGQGSDNNILRYEIRSDRRLGYVPE